MASVPADQQKTRLSHVTHWGAFQAVLRDGVFDRVEPFPGDPFPSPIMNGLPAALTAPSRVQRPAVRRSWLSRRDRLGRGEDDYVELSWDEALGIVAAELSRVRGDYGSEAIYSGSYGWASAGRFHHAKSQLQKFMNLFGGSTVSVQNYSYGAALTLLPHVLGGIDTVAGPVSSWDGLVGSTQLLVSFGGLPLRNTQVEAGGKASHETQGWLRALKASGTEFVNISPLRTDMADWLEPQWLPARPGSDAALILALCHTLLVEKRHDEDFLHRCTSGFDVFSNYLLGHHDGIAKSAEWASLITGLAAPAIVDLARRMAASRTAINLAWGLQRAEHGEQPYWAAIALASMLGQIGLRGGGIAFGYAAVDGMGSATTTHRLPTLAIGKNPIESWIPVARIADMLLTPNTGYTFNGQNRVYPDIRLIYWCGGNPFHHHQDLNRLRQAFRKPETIIVNEYVWTATARHADIVLPATMTMERNDIGASRRDRFLIAMHKIAEPHGEARSDFCIFAHLAEKLGLADRFTQGRNEMQWLRHIYEAARTAADGSVTYPEFDEFWERGTVEFPVSKQPRIDFSSFRRAPPDHPLATPSGRIEIASETIRSFNYPDCPGHPAWLPPTEWLGAPAVAIFPIHLLSSQPENRLHSQLDYAGVSVEAKHSGRENVLINRADADDRGIADGDIVRIWNHRGALLAAARTSDDLLKGVAQLPTGAWYDPDPELGLDRHGNPNAVTHDRPTSSLSQASAAQSCLVQIEKWLGILPAVKAHTPPPLARS